MVSTSIVIGTVIGSGIFMKPGIVISATGNSSMALLAWVIGGVIALASGLTIAEISAQLPKTGGLYHYIEIAYGKFWGFIFGWVQTIVCGPALIGALSLYFGTLVAGFLGLKEDTIVIIGILTLVFLVAMNILGTQFGGYIQNISTLGKLIPIILIAVAGTLKGETPILHMASEQSHAAGMGAAILATLWAYEGWICVSYMAGEMKNPAKDLPRSIFLGILVVITAYLAVNIAMLHVLPASKIVELGPNAASTAATILFGKIGGSLISVGIMVSIFGCLNGKVLTFPRVPLAMAESKMLPFSNILSSVHPKYKTPVGATLSQLIIAILMMLLGNPDRLSDIAIFVLFIFYGLAFISVFLFRKRGIGSNNLYKVPIYPITPIIALLGAIYIIVSTIVRTPMDALLSIGIVVIGIPIFFILESRNKNQKLSKAS